MANDREDAHLNGDQLSDSAEALVAPATPSRRSNSRALKVAGLTTLACLLLASQVFTVYMVIGQSKQINTLNKKSGEVSKQLARTFQGLKSAQGKMQLPINNSPLVMDIEMTEQKAQPPAANPVSLMKTRCQIDAEPGHSKLGVYKPQCDEQGHYKSMQCWQSTGFCWCVDETGTIIEGTATRGKAVCGNGQALGYMQDATTHGDLDGK